MEGEEVDIYIGKFESLTITLLKIPDNCKPELNTAVATFFDSIALFSPYKPPFLKDIVSAKFSKTFVKCL